MAPDSRGLLMDLDGTMADTLPHLCNAFRHAVGPFVKRQPTDAEIVATFGPPERVNVTELLKNPAIADPGALEHVDEAVHRFHDYYERHHSVVKVFPGVPEAINLALERGWKFGVFTGKSRRSAMFALEHLGLLHPVAHVVSGTDVEKPKPDPEGVFLAAQKLGVPPERLLVVGDSVGDIRAGKAAGAKTAATLWGAYDRETTRRAGADWVLERPDDLRGLIDALSRQ